LGSKSANTYKKDDDFLRRGSSWKVQGVRGKTQVSMRLPSRGVRGEQA
tara:strand:+ start:505 stop:648 length:144 start_codon:yes stop_codon:yes gene_type:complete